MADTLRPSPAQASALIMLKVVRDQIDEAEKWLTRSDDLDGQLRALDLVASAVETARVRLTESDRPACSVCDGSGEVTVVGWLAGPNPKRKPCPVCRQPEHTHDRVPAHQCYGCNPQS
jgi:hypothetical protein